MKPKELAREQISLLFKQASGHPDKARKLVAAARKIAAKLRVRIPVEWRRRFCRACNAFLVPGRNCRVRTRAGRVVISCLECLKIRRLPVKR